MAGVNIKQFSARTNPQLTDFLYLVAGTTDHNVTLDSIKTLFNIGDIEEWKTETLPTDTTSYINIEDATIYGAVELTYIAKRVGGAGGYLSGKVTLLVDDSAPNGVTAVNYIDAVRNDGSTLGVVLDNGILSANTLILVVEVTGIGDCIFNYQIINKKPITI